MYSNIPIVHVATRENYLSENVVLQFDILTKKPAQELRWLCSL